MFATRGISDQQRHLGMDTEYSHARIAILHLYPGLLITLLYVITTPLWLQKGYPSLFSLMLSFLIVIVPTELIYLFALGKRLHGHFTLKGVIEHSDLALARFIMIVSVAIITAIIVAGVTQMVDEAIKDRLFGWLPGWYFYDSPLEGEGFTRKALIVTAVLRLFVDGLIIPITEELYFRGFLLSRIKGSGYLVPVYASALFALYHFWQPWNYPTLFIISAILVVPAWYFKSYKLSVYIHTIINTMGAVLFLLMVLGGQQ